MLTSNQIKTVQDTFAAITRRADGTEMTISEMADAVASPFYERLFEIDPRLAPFFQQHLDETKCSFMRVLRTLIRSLDSEDCLKDIQALRQRHIEIARDRHLVISEKNYQDVGAALMATIEKTLKNVGFVKNDRQLEEIRTSWATLYSDIVRIMRTDVAA